MKFSEFSNEILSFLGAKTNAEAPDGSPEAESADRHLLAMEHFNLLIKRLSCDSSTEESEAIAAIFPQFLSDFFNPGDLVNRLLSEWMNVNQNRPKFFALFVMEIFKTLWTKETPTTVCDWALCSLAPLVHQPNMDSIGLRNLTACLAAVSNSDWICSLYVLT